MADFGKILVCYTHRGRDKHELVTDEDVLLKLSETPDLEFKACFTCTEISEEEVEALLASIKTENEQEEFDEEKAAAKVLYDEMKAKYNFE